MNNHKHIAEKTLLFSMATNAALALVKYLAGTYGHSYALIADAIESSTDILSSFFLLIAVLYASKKPSRDYPYGYGKAESLMTVISIIFIFLCGWAIVVQSIQNILTTHATPHPFTLCVLAPIIIWKEICFQIVYRRSLAIDSATLRSEAWHHRSDALTSVAAFIGIAVALIMGPGYEHADDWAALAAAAVLFYNAYKLFIPAFDEIIDGNVYSDLSRKICRLASEVSGVLNTERCYVRKSGMHYHVELHIQVDKDHSVHKGHDIGHNVQRYVQEQIPAIKTLITHVEPFYECENISEKRI